MGHTHASQKNPKNRQRGAAGSFQLNAFLSNVPQGCRLLVTFTSKKRAFGSEHSPDPDCVQRARFVKFTSRLAHFAQFYLKDRLRLGPRGEIAARVRVGQLLPAGLAREDAPSNSSTPAFPQSKRVTDAALLSMLCPAGTGRRSCSRRRRRRRRSCTGR